MYILYIIYIYIVLFCFLLDVMICFFFFFILFFFLLYICTYHSFSLQPFVHIFIIVVFFRFFKWWSISIAEVIVVWRNSIGTGFPKILTVTSIKIEIKYCTSLSYFYLIINSINNYLKLNYIIITNYHLPFPTIYKYYLKFLPQILSHLHPDT